MEQKPIHVLLDNNILLRLVSADGDSPLLRDLEHFENGGNIKILCPESLIEEWQRKSAEKKSGYVKSLDDKIHDANRKKSANHPGAKWGQEWVDRLITAYEDQFRRIDLLLERSQKIERTDQLILQIHALRSAGTAPFARNKKKDNFNDAEIIYSAIRFLVEAGRTDLYFVSDNTDDFAIKKDEKAYLHPEIASFENSLRIHYFTDIRPLFQAFIKIGLPKPPPKKTGDKREILNSIPIDRNAPLVDQVLEYLEKRFEGFAFLPKELFVQHYPFIVGDSFEWFDLPLTLITNNKSLYELLLSDEASLKEKADKIKLRRIKQRLYDNHIMRVVLNHQPEKTINFEPAPQTESGLLKECNNHDFLKIMESLYEDTVTKMASPSDAYLAYKIGDHKLAAEILLACKKALTGKEDFSYYLCCFNLSKLSYILRNYYGDEAALKLSKACSEIDPREEIFKLKQPRELEVAQYLQDGVFFRENFYELTKVLNEIRSLQLRKNTGSNNYTTELMELYFSADHFLNENSVIYDRYTEYRTIVSLYMEGLFASYACSDGLVGKLGSFSDFLIAPLVFYAEPGQIRDQCDRYHIDMAVYQNEPGEASLFSICSNLLEQYNAIMQKFQTKVEKEIPSFLDFYLRKLGSCLVLYAYIDMDSKEVNRIAEKLPSFLIAQNHASYVRLEGWIRLFLTKNEKKLSDQVLQDIFNTTIANMQLHNENFIELLFKLFYRRKLVLQIPEDNFEKFMQNFVGECLLCHQQHSWHPLYEMYILFKDRDYRSQVRRATLNELKRQFDPERYYLALLGRMLRPTNEWDEAYTNHIIELLEIPLQQGIMHRHPAFADRRIDQYINLWFSLKQSVPLEIKDKLIARGTYYQWLFDMEKFDYSQFDIQWLYRHATVHYLKKYKLSKALKKYLTNKMRAGKFHDHIKFFFDIFGT